MIGTMGIPIMTIKPENELPLRHELKHQINLREDLVLSQRLRKLFPHDKNAGPGGTYRVTSLYFDTPYDSALREKIDGVNRREKFRLRYYGTDTLFHQAGKEYKINGLCGKRSARMTQEQVKELLSGSSEFLLDSDEPLFMRALQQNQRERSVAEDHRPLRPGGFSLCARQCAYHVRSGYPHRDWKCGLPESGDFLHARMEPGTVLEVKYDAFLPELVRMAVQVPGRQAAACSKYALCRRFD